MKTREYQPIDAAMVQLIWQRAFAGPPWHEQLDDQEMQKRWQACCNKKGFGCLVMEHDGQVVGFICWNIPTLKELAKKRGSALAAFAAKFQQPVVWLEVICANLDYQRQGIARKLREDAISIFVGKFYDCLLLTRHREDNIPVINLSKSMEFEPTGIKVPSSQVPGLYHEYWYLLEGRDPDCSGGCCHQGW